MLNRDHKLANVRHQQARQYHITELLHTPAVVALVKQHGESGVKYILRMSLELAAICKQILKSK